MFSVMGQMDQGKKKGYFGLDQIWRGRTGYHSPVIFVGKTHLVHYASALLVRVRSQATVRKWLTHPSLPPHTTRMFPTNHCARAFASDVRSSVVSTVHLSTVHCRLQLQVAAMPAGQRDMDSQLVKHGTAKSKKAGWECMQHFREPGCLSELTLTGGVVQGVVNSTIKAIIVRYYSVQ
jgi:hypothetical protein